MGTFLEILAAIARELVLFSVVGFLIGGFDDLLLDAIWLTRSAWREVIVYRKIARADPASIATPQFQGLKAVFVPAWDESAVIGAMLRNASKCFSGHDYRIYVGCYPNDHATLSAIQAVASSRIRAVVGRGQGPTTKADCLNSLWCELIADEAAGGWRAKAIILHDAEDVVHSAELRIFDSLIERFDFVQLPVLPLIDRRSRWIGGHYADEFAEAHGKTMVVREAIGAAIPAAGVGCAFSRAIMGRVADARGGAPFDAESLTEDYELGLRIAELGGQGVFVRMKNISGGGVVAVRAHFPATLDAAVRQKSRWIAGIALSGWDRLGWRGGLAESWMRLHDRRALAAALVTLAAYLGLLLIVAAQLAGLVIGWVPPESPPLLRSLLWFSAALLCWRLAMRFAFVADTYGLTEGLRAVPRAVIANVVAMMAARRAVVIYLRMRRDGIVRWEKTAHDFPTVVPAE